MISLYLASFLVSFTYIFLKGWQHKCVIGNHFRSAGAIAFIMGAMEVVSVSVIVKGGWGMAITMGAGAALGIVSAMKLHDRMYGSKS